MPTPSFSFSSLSPVSVQMSSYVVLGRGTPSPVVDAVLSVLRMQAPSTTDGPGLCAVRDLTADGKVGLEVGLQLAVGVVMVVLVAASLWLRGPWVAVVSGMKRRASPVLGATGNADLQAGLLDHGSVDGSVACGEPARVSILNMRDDEQCEPGASRDSTVTVSQSPSSPSDGTKLPPRVRYLTAAVNFGVTAYSTVTVAVVRMLHCVWVPGTPLHQRRLFIRGSVVCDYTGWQVPYMVSLVVLVVVPVTLPLVAAWSRRANVPVPICDAAGPRRRCVGMCVPASRDS
jgi:hypothetical protein